MGTIYKKGIPYSTSSNNALNIKYDNGGSGLTSANVQGAIDEVKEEIGSTEIPSALGDNITDAISSLNSTLTPSNQSFSPTIGGFTQGAGNYQKYGKVVTLSFNAYYTGNLQTRTEYTCGILPKPLVSGKIGLCMCDNGALGHLKIDENGSLKLIPISAIFPANTYFSGFATYISQ